MDRFLGQSEVWNVKRYDLVLCDLEMERHLFGVHIFFWLDQVTVIA
jgi:hypothetical protein